MPCSSQTADSRVGMSGPLARWGFVCCLVTGDPECRRRCLMQTTQDEISIPPRRRARSKMKVGHPAVQQVRLAAAAAAASYCRRGTEAASSGPERLQASWLIHREMAQGGHWPGWHSQASSGAGLSARIAAQGKCSPGCPLDSLSEESGLAASLAADVAAAAEIRAFCSRHLTSAPQADPLSGWIGVSGRENRTEPQLNL
jgi:hypothetical protein